ncbi:MAG: glycosyltransferase family 4 protein [Bacteroidetes bacterium]|nr:glycosyltransferase family 4 protein [Bacteroidota bacterium]
MLKVLSIVSYNFLPSKMGGQKGIGFFYSFLGKIAAVTCLTTRSNDLNCAHTYKVLNVLSESKLRYINLFYFFTARRILRSAQIKHVIIEHPYYGWLAILLKRFCRVQLIVHSHNIEAVRFKSIGKWWWKILWQYEKWTHRHADINFFITDEDRIFAIEQYQLDEKKCFTITYGIAFNQSPSPTERLAAKQKLSAQFQIDEKTTILLFNGTLNYQPNLDAVDVIINQINPVLKHTPDFKYKIFICGKGLPASYTALQNGDIDNIIYAGFVEDINLFFLGADIFINPVIDGGGIKTKLVEALGYNLNVVSSKSGATGIPSTVTGNKLKITADGDWATFTEQIKHSVSVQNIPQDFFAHFYWGNIAAKAAETINKTNN